MRKFSAFSAGFALAVLLAAYLLGEFVGVLAILAGTSVIMLVIWRKTDILLGAIFLLSIFLGSLWWLFYTQVTYLPAVSLAGSVRSIEVIALDYPEEKEFSSRLYAKTVPGNHKINLRINENFDIEPGDRLSLQAEISTPTPTRDFDFLIYYRSKGIFIDGKQTGELTVEKVTKRPLYLVPTVFKRLISQKIDVLYNGNNRSIILGMLTGDTGSISQTFRMRLSATGLSHIIAVSGMHVSFLIGFIVIFIKNKKLAALISFPIIIFFVMMTGGAPSAVRACVVQSIVLIGRISNRDDDPITSLSAALLFLLLINPFSITDVGLQLSFLATLGLILFSGPIKSTIDRTFKIKKQKQPILRFISSTISATLAASVLSAIPVSYYFGRFSLAAPLGNLAVLWMLPGVFVGGLITVVVSFISLKVASLLAFPVALGLKYIESVVMFLGKLPFASLGTQNPFILMWILFFYIMVLILFVKGGNRRTFILTGSAICVTLAVTLLLSEIDHTLPDLRISVMDVGQGQSIAATSGPHTVLIDCGGDRWQGTGNIVSEHLLDRNRRRIDLLILTHTHADHINGIDELLENVSISYVALPATIASEEMAEALRLRGIEVISVSSSFMLDMGRSSVTVYRPIVKKSGDEEGICVLLSSGDFELLVTGDLNEVSERILLEREPIGNIEVLVAGHHGSGNSTSESLLDHSSPEVCVISVGADNSYGHPSQKTLKRVKEYKVPVFRTDQNGTINIAINSASGR